MRSQEFFVHEFANGLTLLAEQMPEVSSAAVSIMIPSGAAIDPDGLEGSANVLLEMLQKGAGEWNSRAFSERFEELGVRRSYSAGVEVSVYSASMVADRLLRALELMSILLLKPRLPEEELESVKSLALQDIDALEDEPASKIMNELAKKFYPYPFGRSQLGTKEGIEAIDIAKVRKHYGDVFRKQRLIIGVSGKFDWTALQAAVAKFFSDWNGKTEFLPVPEFSKSSSTSHLQQDTHQIQIALAYPSVSFGHRDYYVSRVASGILSGGMAGRLFIEVREKRGLVYRVGASHSAARGRGAMFAYAGTTPENAEETLAVMVGELRKLAQGVTDEELARAKVDLKSALIMQSEQSSVRANALVNDWWNLGRLRQLSEIRAGIEGVTNEDIMRHLKEYPVSPVTLLTLGPKALELPK